jgi:hypothetical protein
VCLCFLVRLPAISTSLNFHGQEFA